MKFKQNKACRNENFWLFNKLQLVLLILYLLNNSMKVVLFSPSYVEGNQTLEILHLREVTQLTSGRTHIQIQDYLTPLPKSDTVATCFPNPQLD